MVSYPGTVLALEDVRAYLGAVTVDEDALAYALAAEQALQAAMCRVPSSWDVSSEATVARTVLNEALCRRVAVNLARRGLPLGMQMTDVGTARISSTDPEVRRLEAPYRKTVLG